MKTTAVILAAGQGTRMKSDLPKVLHQVLAKPMIQWVIDSVQAAEVDQIITVLGHKSEAVAEVVGGQTQVVYQREQLGTGHAVMQAAEQLADEAGCVLVVCGDTPLLTAETLRALLTKHQTEQNAVTVLTAKASDPYGYGRMIREQERIVAIVEEKDATEAQKAITEINAGTYCFDQRFLLDALKHLKTDNAQGEYYLTDVIKMAVEQGLTVGGYILRDFTESLGVNNRVQLAQAEKIMRQRKLQELMLNGVTIIDPEHTYVDMDVQVGQDTILAPGVMLEGQTRVGCRCRIGANTRLTDAIVGDETTVQNSIIWESTVGSRCQIGPFAYIRPGSVLADEVKVGDFVELKKAQVASGSKIPHLSYVGDAAIGARVNIGCGTITCNYDGKNKHQTIIEDDAFIGSNTNLVAPVTIHAGATIGAGSTICKDIPANSLGLTRPELKIKENWRKNK